MIRIDSFSVLDGISVRAVGVCLTEHIVSGRCQGMSVQTLIPAEAVEALGSEIALSNGISMLLSAEPRLAEFILH